VKDPVVYPEPVEGQGLDTEEIFTHATAAVPPAQMYPVGQGAHWKFKAGGGLFALGEPVNKIGLGTRN